MSLFRLLLALVGALSFRCLTFGAVVPQEGDYLETGYVELLKQKRSPLLAAAPDGKLGVAQVVTVQSAYDDIEFNLDFNWHEGEILFTLHPDSVVSYNRNWGGAEKSQLRIQDRHHFALSAPGSPLRSYMFVGNSGRFIEQTVLVGRYRDEHGMSVVFDSDGHVVFGSSQFEYDIRLEQVFDHYDFFRIGKRHYVAFQWEGSDLLLFPVIETDGPGYGKPDFKHPTARLRESLSARP